MGKVTGEMQMNITVYLGANEGSDPALKQAVEELGRWVGESGNALVYGGSRSGLMGRLAHSVLTAGGEVTGVEPQFFIDSEVQYAASLLGIPDSELTLGGRKAIARWYEVYGYDDAMVQEAAVQAGPKRDLWYWNSILKTWNAKGLRNIHDVRTPVAAAGASRNIRVDRETPSGNDFLKNAARRRTLKKKSE